MSQQIETTRSQHYDIDTLETVPSTTNGNSLSLSDKEVVQGRIVNSVTNSSQVHIENTSHNVYNAPVVVNHIYQQQYDNVEQLADSDAVRENTFFETFSIFRSKIKQLRSTEYYIAVPFLLILLIALIIALEIWLFHSQNSHSLHPPNPSNVTSNQTDLRIVLRNEWNAKPPKATAGPLSIKPPPLVIINHTRTMLCYFLEQCIGLVRIVQNYHMFNMTWNDIGYNFLVGGDGLVYEGRGWNVVGSHTLFYNQWSIGISLIGTFYREEPTKVQLRATQQLIEYGVKNGYISVDYKLFGHRQCRENSTSPGDSFYRIMKTWDHWSPTCPKYM